MKLKVCGLKYFENIMEVTNLEPDFIGLIFYEESPRYFEGLLPEIPSAVKKIGVFVNESDSKVLNKVGAFDLYAVQLHGQESPDFCSSLKLADKKLKIIKAFSVSNDFDFDVLKPYEKLCDYFLFDTKGELPGGNGFKFDWNVLQNYSSKVPYFLSGGIGLDDIDDLREFQKDAASKQCYAVDVNSRFEIEPGLKNTDKLIEFKSLL
ncbi:MAG: phosphoribosylanthranilate isomerase [Flavobacteriaceae bacterium]|nr:phosphoribosylanthranilate isomerase [Flavobacteriaceae bacterium]